MSVAFWVVFVIGASVLQLLPGAGKRALLSYARSGKPLRTALASLAVSLSASCVMALLLLALGFVMRSSELVAAVVGGFGLSVLLIGSVIAWRVRGITGPVADNDNLPETKPLQTFGKIAWDTATDRWQALLFAALASQFFATGLPIFKQAFVLSLTFFAISTVAALVYVFAHERVLTLLRKLEARKIKGRARGCLRVSTGVVTVGYRRLAA